MSESPIKPQLRAPEEGQVPGLWMRATPPELFASVDFSPWSGGKPIPGGKPPDEWEIAVWGPYELNDGLLISTKQKLHRFQPSRNQELYSAFAHIAEPLQRPVEAAAPPLEAERRAIEFVNAYGLTVLWTPMKDAEAWEPPLQQSLRPLIVDAREMRDLLGAWRVVRAAPPRLQDQATYKLDRAFDKASEVLREASESVSWRLGRSAAVKWKRPLSLSELMLLQFVRDVLGDLEVKECPVCHKLFVRPEVPRIGESDRKRPPRTRGVKFCSVKHANVYAQRKKREKEG